MKKSTGFYCVVFLLFYFFHYSFASAQQSTLSKKDTAEVRFINQRKFYIYKVEKEETLSSVLEKFGIPKEEVEEFNPELKEGLKIKMKLWIPALSYTKKSEAITESHETGHRDEVYRVALITALNIAQNYSFDSTLVDSGFLNSELGEETIANLEFYEGMLLAFDSLKKDKLKVHLYLFDSENNSLALNEHLNNPVMKTMDLIVSNGNVLSTRLINSFSKNNHILFSSFAINATDWMKDNSNAIAMLPSSLTQCREMGKFSAAKFRHSNAIILNTAQSKENERSDAFKKGWLDAMDKKIKNVTYASGNYKVTSDSLTSFQNTIKGHLINNEDNLIFVPSSNEEFVSTLIYELKEFSEQFRITMIGLPTWQHFETIDPLFLELLNVHIFTSSFISYSSEASLLFRKKYVDTYNVEPMDAAFQGFDHGMIVRSLLVNKERKLDDYLEKSRYKGLITNYQFKRVPEFSFFENHYITVCKYRNYELKKINE